MNDPAHYYVASLTGLRGVAAVSVFLFHYDALNPGIRLDLMVPVIGHVLQFPLGLGFAGVDLFFVLSSFLLTLPFAAATLTASNPPLNCALLQATAMAGSSGVLRSTNHFIACRVLVCHLAPAWQQLTDRSIFHVFQYRLGAGTPPGGRMVDAASGNVFLPLAAVSRALHETIKVGVFPRRWSDSEHVVSILGRHAFCG